MTAISVSSQLEHKHLCVSGGGDGKLCLWDFTCGKLLHTINAGEGAVKIDRQIQKGTRSSHKEKVEEKFASKCDAEIGWICCCPLSGHFAVSVKRSSSIQIYQIVTTDKDLSNRELELWKTIHAKGEVLAGSFDPITGALLLLWANEGKDKFMVGLQAFPLHEKTDPSSTALVTQGAVKLENKIREVR